MKIKASYPHTPIEIAKIQKPDWHRCRTMGTRIHRQWERKIPQPIWKTVWQVLSKLKIVSQYDQAVALPGFFVCFFFNPTNRTTCIHTKSTWECS